MSGLLILLTRLFSEWSRSFLESPIHLFTFSGLWIQLQEPPRQSISGIFLFFNWLFFVEVSVTASLFRTPGPLSFYYLRIFHISFNWWCFFFFIEVSVTTSLPRSSGPLLFYYLRIFHISFNWWVIYWSLSESKFPKIFRTPIILLFEDFSH